MARGVLFVVARVIGVAGAPYWRWLKSRGDRSARPAPVPIRESSSSRWGWRPRLPPVAVGESGGRCRPLRATDLSRTGVLDRPKPISPHASASLGLAFGAEWGPSWVSRSRRPRLQGVFEGGLPLSVHGRRIRDLPSKVGRFVASSLPLESRSQPATECSSDGSGQ